MRDFNRSGGSNSGSRFSGRDSRKRTFGGGNRDFGRPQLQMHQAICDDCGKSCEVPFIPSGNKEIFCSECFNKRGGKEGLGRRSEERNYNRSDNRDDNRNSRYESGEREMFSATCDECGKACKVPFRPSGDKPVYCSDCFGERGERAGLHDRPDYNRNKKQSFGGDAASENTSNRKELAELRDQVTSMNVKLEKIMAALSIKSVKIKVTKEQFADSQAETVKTPELKVAAKAPAKKKVVAKKAVDKKTTVKKTVKKTAKKATK